MYTLLQGLLLAAVALGAASADALQNASSTIPRPGSLRRAADAQAENSSVCEFLIQGYVMQGDASISTRSLGASPTVQPRAPLKAARVTCRGKPVWLRGGPLLEPFAKNFVGVRFSRQYNLPGATMLLSNATVVIQNSVFSQLSWHGQAALVVQNSDVTFFNTTFAFNNNSNAGAVYASGNSSLVVLDSLFSNNAGSDGGAITMWNSSLLVNGTAFTNNSAGGTGGALNLNSAVNVTVMSSVFRGNEAQNGGGVCVKQCERSTFFDNSFTGNWADNSGGALFQLQCNGDVTDTYFRDNQALNGASVWQNDCKRVVHSGSRFDNNAASKGSAGIELNQCGVDIGFCTFARGRGSKGAAIYMQGTTGNVHDCEFDGNAALDGGAVFRGSSSGNVAGSLFRNNTAREFGGAVYDSHVQGDIMGNTFGGNTCQGGRGGSVFRTVSSGSVGSDQGLQDEMDADVALDNPAPA